MTSPPRATKTKSRVTLLLIAAVFGLPFVLAWVFVIGPLDWRQVGTVNYGVLVEPPLLMESHGVMDDTGAAPPRDSVGGDWFLVVLSNSACKEQCTHWLQIAERIQIAVGRDMSRVTLALLGPDDDALTLPLKENRQSWRLPLDGGLTAALAQATGEAPPEARLLIVDYRGRIVLAYPPTEDGRGVLDDLKRLLRATAR